MKYALPLCVSAVLLLFAGCSGGADAVIRRNGSAEVSLDFSLTPAAVRLIRGLGAALGQGGENSPVIDGPALARSLARSPGVSRAEFLNRDASSVTGSASLSRVDEFLSVPLAGSVPLVSWDSAGYLAVSLNRETAPVFLGLLPVEAAEYLAAVMAPCATGETLSRQEYLALIASVYGRSLADEMSAARLQLAVTVPGAVRSVSSGSFQGNRAVFAIPLLDILVLERPLLYEILWNR